MGGNQEAAAVGRGGLHELGTGRVLLVSIATSTFSEADSPSPWLGKSFLAHQISAPFKRKKRKFTLYFFYSFKLSIFPYPCLLLNLTSQKTLLPSAFNLQVSLVLEEEGFKAKSLVLFTTAVAALNAPAQSSLCCSWLGC